MKQKQKPLSFSLHPDNIAYIKGEWGIKHRSPSHWMDDLITHLRLKKGTPKPKAKTKRFVPPSVSEVKEYCDSRGNKVDAETFVAHYNANGWVQGKNKPVKCWKSCVITWEKSKPKGNTRDDIDFNDRTWADGFKLKIKN